MDTPLISVVMPHHRRSGLLRRTLLSIQAQADRPSFEVVIVNDDRHDDRLAAVCREFRNNPVFGGDIRLFDTGRTYPYRGPAYPWNCAVRQARGEHILIQSPECLHVGPVLRGMVNQLAKPSLHRPYLCARCMELKIGDSDFLDEHEARWTADPNLLRRFDYPARPEYCGPTAPQPWFYFAAGMRRDDYLAIGGLDERFTHLAYEDNFFSFLLEQWGFDRQLIAAPFYVLHQYHAKPNNGTDPAHYLATSRMAQLYRMLCAAVAGGAPPLANPGTNWGLLPGGAEVDLGGERGSDVQG